MAKCEVLNGARWSVFSAAGFRRRLLEAMLCGVSNDPRRQIVERRSDRLADLLLVEARDLRSREVAEKRRKMEAFEELQSVVRRLQDTEEGIHRRRAEAAAEVRRLAKDSPDFRQSLALLGAIPPLVALLDSDDSDSLISALYALLNLGIGNEANKSAIVAAGAIQKMVSLIKSGPTPAAEAAIIANFLGLSALDANKAIIGASSDVIPFLLNAFRSSNSISSTQSQEDALRALYNLSISPANGVALVNAGIVPCILSALVDDTEFSEWSLAVLCNLVAASPEGRRAVSRTADAFPMLIDVLHWSDFPRCQEKAAHILMVMAHKSHGVERAAMAAAGITSALLELTLMGSTLAQKRASLILKILREEKGKQVVVSEPLGSCGASASSAATEEEEEEEGVSAEMRAVRKLVKQSLQSNMRRIARRANFPPEFSPSDRFRELTASSTSKSLTLW
ncbi:U-box domain-containing protein 12 [Dendrobium catenatum]|uniref:U-box domain-containing protein 12 n=1 Tax=Dendrobium catenatum TaxID=906689 RepID=A0A2I0VU14_9ASPA|nr:U-box domain-containing protein 12 [Dendrobium catenatum]PKU66901.1 U-box domain-containing protein 12 [Dendrobium catenatum]